MREREREVKCEGICAKKRGEGRACKEGGMERKREGEREMSMQERECAREKGERVCESERVE